MDPTPATRWVFFCNQLSGTLMIPLFSKNKNPKSTDQLGFIFAYTWRWQVLWWRDYNI